MTDSQESGAELAELAMLIKQLAHQLRLARPSGSALCDRAIDYLRRHNLLGSPLRSTALPAQTVPDDTCRLDWIEARAIEPRAQVQIAQSMLKSGFEIATSRGITVRAGTLRDALDAVMADDRWMR